MRVLCLHGWRTSGQILRQQMEDISVALSSVIGGALDMHYLDAPHTASGPPSPDVAAVWPDEPYFEWWDAVDGSYVGKEKSFACACPASYPAARTRTNPQAHACSMRRPA